MELADPGHHRRRPGGLGQHVRRDRELPAAGPAALLRRGPRPAYRPRHRGSPRTAPTRLVVVEVVRPRHLQHGAVLRPAVHRGIPVARRTRVDRDGDVPPRGHVACRGADPRARHRRRDRRRHRRGRRSRAPRAASRRGGRPRRPAGGDRCRPGLGDRIRPGQALGAPGRPHHGHRMAAHGCRPRPRADRAARRRSPASRRRHQHHGLSLPRHDRHRAGVRLLVPWAEPHDGRLDRVGRPGQPRRRDRARSRGDARGVRRGPAPRGRSWCSAGCLPASLPRSQRSAGRFNAVWFRAGRRRPRPCWSGRKRSARPTARSESRAGRR